jgi:hypothetical protein
MIDDPEREGRNEFVGEFAREERADPLYDDELELVPM